MALEVMLIYELNLQRNTTHTHKKNPAPFFHIAGLGLNLSQKADSSCSPPSGSSSRSKVSMLQNERETFSKVFTVLFIYYCNINVSAAVC